MERHGGAAAEAIQAPSTKPLQIVRCQHRRAQHHCGDPDQFQTDWADVCGFLKPPDSDQFWKVRMHGAFSIPRKALGPRPTDQSCHPETWLHLDFVDWSNSQSHHEEPDRRIPLKERPTPYQYGQRKRSIRDNVSYHLLSS